MKKIKRRTLLTLSSLGVAGLLYLVYALILVPEFLGRRVAPVPGTVAVTPDAGGANPTLSPDTVPNADSTAGPATNVLNRYRDYLSMLFPDPNDWRHREANLIVPKEDTGMLLFKGDPHILAGGRTIRLDACTIILLGGDESLDLKERWRRSLVLETSENVTLYFTKPLSQYSQPDFSAFDRGELNGQVIIRSDMDSPDPTDNLLLQTRNVSFNLTQVLANNEVVFQMGPQNGDGEGLTLELDVPPLALNAGNKKPASEDPIRNAVADGNLAAGISITRIELKQLNRLQFPLPGDYLDELQTNGAEGGQATADDSRPGVMVDVRCKQGFYFAPNPEEVAGWVGRFMGDVEVLVLKPDVKHDCLKCKNLYLYFVDPILESLLHRQESDPRLLSRKKRPTGQLNHLQAVKLKAVRTDESPATVEVPQYNFNAEADELIYDLRTRSITLQATQSGQKVLLKKDNITVSGEGVSWAAANDGSFGTILAGRNGTFDTTMEDKGQIRRFHASWKEGLKISPEAGTPGLVRFAAMGGAIFRLDGLGTIRAEEADFWASFDRDATAASAPDASSPLASAKNVTPHSAQFRGNIRLETPGGDGEIKRELTIRFQTETTTNQANSSDAPPVTTPTAPEQIQDQTPRNSLFGDGTSDTRYVLAGDSVDLWMVRDSDNYRPSHILISGNVRFNEKNATEPDSLRIEGDKVRIVEPFSTSTFVDLVGENARFNGKGLQLTGYHVTVNKAENSFAVLGPGRLSLVPQKNLSAGDSPSPLTNDPVEILWSKQMYFNGQTLFFQAQPGQDVTVSQKTNRISCPEIRVSLKRPVSIFEMRAENDSSLVSELDVIECVGTADHKVNVEFFTMGAPDSASGEHSTNNIEVGVYRAAVENFLYKYDTNDFAGQGPGWLRASIKTRENNPSSAELVPGGTGFGRLPWKQLHLTFQESITGNVKERVVRINSQVESVFGSTERQNDSVDVTRPEEFPQDAVTLNCEKLQINQTQGTDTGQGDLELAAFGNVLFRYDVIVGRGESVKYVDGKKMVWLEGDSATPASLFKKEHATAPSISLGRFMRGSYNLVTKKVEVENYSNTIGGSGF
ncbi:MAG: hypothetical protein Q4G68_13190 [Planctomycetia bacterium]|nr:hypothetical protein [Planctomycetia bacterium]